MLLSAQSSPTPSLYLLLSYKLLISLSSSLPTVHFTKNLSLSRSLTRSSGYEVPRSHFSGGSLSCSCASPCSCSECFSPCFRSVRCQSETEGRSHWDVETLGEREKTHALFSVNEHSRRKCKESISKTFKWIFLWRKISTHQWMKRLRYFFTLPHFLSIQRGWRKKLIITKASQHVLA